MYSKTSICTSLPKRLPYQAAVLAIFLSSFLLGAGCESDLPDKYVYPVSGSSSEIPLSLHAGNSPLTFTIAVQAIGNSLSYKTGVPWGFVTVLLNGSSMSGTSRVRSALTSVRAPENDTATDTTITATQEYEVASFECDYFSVDWGFAIQHTVCADELTFEFLSGTQIDGTFTVKAEFGVSGIVGLPVPPPVFEVVVTPVP